MMTSHANNCRSPTVWKKIIFRYFEDYNSANMTDILKIPFDYCLEIIVPGKLFETLDMSGNWGMLIL